MISTPTILAIDLGKFNSVFCAFDVATKATAFRTVETTPANFREAIVRQPAVTVVVEACSPAGWVHDLCEELGVPILVANTNADAWSWKNVKRKTDVLERRGWTLARINGSHHIDRPTGRAGDGPFPFDHRGRCGILAKSPLRLNRC